MKNQTLYIYTAILLLVQLTCFKSTLFSQVKVGNNPTLINPNSILEIESTNKGLLLPRLTLTSTNNPAPLSNFVQGMFIYNTATAGDVTPGTYYSDGLKWIKLNGAVNNSNDWSIIGNNGTNPNTNFLGTTDNNDLVFKTNSQERLRIKNNGWMGIGTATPQAALQIKGQLIIDTLQSGNQSVDRLLVADASGRVKSIPANSSSSGVQKKFETVSSTGQTTFVTPTTITDPNKIFLYRNGVMIAFSVSGSNTILAEIPSIQGDEIKIVQIL